MKDALIRPFLKWAGGKYQLLPELMPHLEGGRCLLEPFVGAGAVFLNSDFKRYHINDANPDLIHVYETLKVEGQSFIEYAQSFFKKKTNQEHYYYAARDKFNALDHTPEKAALFIYLNRHGYNGLCRYNSKGIYNVPFGRYKRPALPTESMAAFHEKLQDSKITCEHFAKVMKRIGKYTIVYCDPPYVPLSSTAHFTRYSRLQFLEEEQRQLADCAKRLQKKGHRVILSNHDTPLTREMYSGASIQSLDVNRSISCAAYRRDPVRELIAVF